MRVLIWTGFQRAEQSIYDKLFERITNGKCPSKNTCQITMDKKLVTESDAILFFLPNLHWENYNLPKFRDPKIPWIFGAYESTLSIQERAGLYSKTKILNYDLMNNLFNRTMSFRSDADIVAKHGYTEKLTKPLTSKELSNMYSNIPRPDFKHYTLQYYRSIQNKDKNKSAPGSPIAWFVSHCNTMTGREEYVNQLQRNIGVDIYGKCGSFSCGEVRNVNNRFYLAFENTFCKDYITEKAFNSLLLNTIPIVMGGVNYTQELPPGSFINAAEFSNPDNLAFYLYYLLQNEEEYNKYFKWRKYYKVHTFLSVPDACELCDKLHSGELLQQKVYGDMRHWFSHISGCIKRKGKSWNWLWTRAGARTSAHPHSIRQLFKNPPVL